MKKTKVTLLCLFLSFLSPLTASAASVTNAQYSDSDDIYYVYMDMSGADSFTITQDSTGKKWSYNVAPDGDYTTLTCNGTFTYQFYSGSDVIATDTITTSQIVEQNSSCESTENNENDSGNCGCIFRTPGWQDYLDEIGDIKDAIPSPPNWGSVADTFRDSIVPSLIGEVENVLGSPPEQISAPSYPPDLDDGNLQEPEGEEAPGFEGFDENDIKEKAKEKQIEFREDDSGGFNIDNPIESMPEKEILEPEEQENPRPGEPKEEETQRPEPEEPEKEAPTPEEPNNPKPVPEEPESERPTPGGSEEQPPTPGESENPAPIPGGTENEPPKPGDSGWSPPTPSDQGGGYPMPNGGETNAPIPSGGSSGYPMP